MKARSERCIFQVERFNKNHGVKPFRSFPRITGFRQQQKKGSQMKKVVRNLIIATVTGMIAVTTARGQFNTITVDESGKGFYNGVLLPSGFFADPFNGNTNGFAYVLPFNYTYAGAPAADIQVFEPGATLPSDLLRFTRNPSGPGSLLFFYSDASPTDPPNDPADVLALPVNSAFFYTSGPEIGLFGNSYSEAGPNGFLYKAFPGMPGEDGTGVALDYTFISDAVVVPEPNASLLASLGGGCLFLALRSLRTLRRK
jgi:hypothetical protein